MIRLLCVLLLVAVATGPLTARAEAPRPAGLSALRLLPGWRVSEGRHMAALEIRLAPGWKTYWRRPGEAGIPPSFDWSGSTNVAGIALHWPAPEVFRQGGMRSIGYPGGVVLPVEIRTLRPGQPVDLHLTMDLGLCREICVPVSATRTARLGTADREPDPRIRSALAARPLTAAEAGAGPAQCRLVAAANGAALELSLRLPPLGGDEEMVIELSDPGTWISEPVLRREGERLLARADMEPPRGAPLLLDRAGLRATVIGPYGAVEIAGCN